MIGINNKKISSIIFNRLALFSENVSSQNISVKSYKMPQRQVQRLFKPKRSIKFNQGRSLIYLNKQGLFTPTLLTTHLTIPMIYLAYLIKNNPFYLTFPAALPIMGFIQMFLFMRFITHKKDNKYQIQRIYLTSTGDMIQVWLANKIRRKLKNTDDNLYLMIKDLKSPPINDNQLPRKGTSFPQSYNGFEWPAPWQYGWMKYDMNRENYIIPKKCQYANWEVLIPVMKGIKIDISDCPKTPIPIDQQRKMPTLEDALTQAQNIKKYQKQWEQKYGKLDYTVQEQKQIFGQNNQ